MRTTFRDRSRGARDLWARARVATGQARKGIAPLPGLITPESDARLAVNCVVFSKDRAMQLDACLRSIELLAPYSGPIVVVYLATTADFANGYRRLPSGERVRFVEQGDDFQGAVLSALDPRSACTVFHTDDDVFFRKPATVPVLPPGFAAFSLRLGKNTTYCHTADRAQRVPEAASDGGDLLAWNWARAEGDFAYPMSLDGHIFSTELLLRMLHRARFTNPNHLEEELHYRRYLAPPSMLSFRESCLVSIPANIVSATHQNRARHSADTSAEALNVRFLAGERIDLAAMDFSAVRGAHQAIPYAFTRADA